jgi:hypothetical protein
MREHVVIEPRFRGFAEVALGGYVGGLLAGALGAATEVRLRGIVPMGRPLALGRPQPDFVNLTEDGTVLAEARRAPLDLDLPDPVSLTEAETASARYPGFAAHPFPGCFCCGPARAPGDGLRIFPGPVAGRELVAAPWTPDAALAGPTGAVRPEFVWAALDCPQLWALMTSAPRDSDERVVTASMTVRIDSTPVAGLPHVVLAWPLHRDGRSLFAGGAVLDQDGEPLVIGVQRAVVVPGRGVPLGLDHC